MLYDNSSVVALLGCIANDTSLVINDKFPLCKEDFIIKFHQILYVAFKQLANRGIKEITDFEVGEYMKSYKPQLSVLEDNNYLEFIDTIKNVATPENYQYYYNNIRKFSLLREYKENNIDISEIFDESLDEDGQRKKIEEVSIEEITNFFEGKIVAIKKKFNVQSMYREIQAGVNWQQYKEQFKETPMFGALMQSPYQTEIYGGWCKGQLLMRSAPSGFGKTILAVGDLCKVCVTEYYDPHKGKYVINENKQGNGLFINTEMDLEKELTPMFVAWISNVERGKIKLGEYEGDEEERVDRAIKILEESNIYLVDDPKFTLVSLENTIKDYVLNKHVDYCVFDYLQDNGVIGKEMKKTHEIVARDTIILNMGECLQMWAREYNLGILGATQCNGNEKLREIIDEDCLAGGRAIKNKVVCGSIIMPPRKKELEKVRPLIQKLNMARGFDNTPECNLVSHNYKIRFGRYGVNLKIYHSVDLGTGRVKDLCCVNAYDEPIKNLKIPTIS